MTKFIPLVSLALLIGCAGAPDTDAGKTDPSSTAATGGATTGAAGGTETNPPGPPMLLDDLAGASHDVNAELAAGRNVVLVFWQVW